MEATITLRYLPSLPQGALNAAIQSTLFILTFRFEIAHISYSTAHRPLSSASLNSEVSNATTVETKASVNDILSMAADAEDMSVYSLDLDNQAMSFGALMKMSPVQPQVSLDITQRALMAYLWFTSGELDILCNLFFRP